MKRAYRLSMALLGGQDAHQAPTRHHQQPLQRPGTKHHHIGIAASSTVCRAQHHGDGEVIASSCTHGVLGHRINCKCLRNGACCGGSLLNECIRTATCHGGIGEQEAVLEDAEDVRLYVAGCGDGVTSCGFGAVGRK